MAWEKSHNLGLSEIIQVDHNWRGSRMENMCAIVSGLLSFGFSALTGVPSVPFSCIH